jgi:pyruvate/2-oxoglutarate dehydrogenase complex dihydrolipoamide acyltransferase (E2) component
MALTARRQHLREDDPRKRKLITLSATVDHRFIDGYQAGVLAHTARDCFENPERFGA